MRLSTLWRSVHPLLCTALLLVASATTAQAQDTPVPGTTSANAAPNVAARSASARPLSPTAIETGLISVSIDGVGSINANGATVQVEKPAGGTVRAAYYIGTANYNGALSANVTLSNGASSLTIAPGDYDATARNASGGNQTENGFEDVTAFVKPIVDAAPAGLIDFTVTEASPFATEGNALIVVFNDPAITTVGTFVLAFGSQQTTGDSFAITLGSPFDASSQSIQMSLGITFGFQTTSHTAQFSEIDVNGTRLTSSAGGQDDCDVFTPPNGCSQDAALVTVGGIGDDPANPADPNAGPGSEGARSDDELYTLDGLIANGTTNIKVDTRNPSNNDNIFFAAFVINGTAAIVGEGILLTPTTATNPVNTSHTVTALVQDDDGNPIAGRNVDFEILSGPNAGLTGSEVTDGSGNAKFTWSSTTAGTDVVVARFLDSQQVLRTSNEASKTWEDGVTNLACSKDATLAFGDFDIDGNDPTYGEFAEVKNSEGLDVDLTACSFATFDPLTEKVIYTTPATGTVSATSSYVFASQNGDQAIPLGSIADGPVGPDRPGALVLLEGTTSVGSSVGDVLSSVVAGLVYRNEDDVFAAMSGGGTATSREEQRAAFLAALARLGQPVADEGDVHGIDLDVAAAPNPLRDRTTVSFGVAAATDVRVAVYDPLGREVALLAEAPYSAGRHEVTFEARDLPAGVYVIRAIVGSDARTARVTITR